MRFNMATNNDKNQIPLDGVPAKRGRPARSDALTAAERQRIYRNNKKRAQETELRRYVPRATLLELERLEKSGVTLEQIIAAYKN